MIMNPSTKTEYRQRRHMRLRQKVRGTASRPRMSVFISNKHMYVQFIDDDAAATLATASTLSPGTKAGASAKISVELAKTLGQQAAKLAKAKGIETVVFDRGGFAFRGRMKALAEAAREGGLKF